MYDLNNAEAQRATGELIPDGSFVRLHMHIRHGGYTGRDIEADDQGVLLASKSGQTKGLDCEFTVLTGPHAKRKLWQLLTVAGGKTNEKGVSIASGISLRMIRAMVESAYALDPNDNSDEVKQKRRINSLAQLEGIEFFARVKVEPGSPDDRGGYYPDKNQIDIVIVRGMPEYDVLYAGGEVPPKPSVRARPTAVTRPAYGQPPAAPQWTQQPAATPQQNGYMPQPQYAQPAPSQQYHAPAAPPLPLMQPYPPPAPPVAPAWPQQPPAANPAAAGSTPPTWLKSAG